MRLQKPIWRLRPTSGVKVLTRRRVMEPDPITKRHYWRLRGTDFLSFSSSSWSSFSCSGSFLLIAVAVVGAISSIVLFFSLRFGLLLSSVADDRTPKVIGGRMRGAVVRYFLYQEYRRIYFQLNSIEQTCGCIKRKRSFVSKRLRLLGQGPRLQFASLGQFVRQS